ncbi:hypothetical protein BLNAU_13272 [Blattamonas nauphoetae]|uniref:Uncharacterized protein n=1 Tax=Blattamonas nauphoetae TaxID=2049346 RepID=A0ABQ9XJX0_9EUKA|nr:hypothetical protein BLNAU_13272 [Blattamonas nauphoetae]
MDRTADDEEVTETGVTDVPPVISINEDATRVRLLIATGESVHEQRERVPVDANANIGEQEQEMEEHESEKRHEWVREAKSELATDNDENEGVSVSYAPSKDKAVAERSERVISSELNLGSDRLLSPA